MHTIQKTKNTPCNQPFNELLAETFKKLPEKKPDRRKENRDKHDNNYHFTPTTLALLILMVVLVAGLTAYVVGSIKCRHVIAEQSLRKVNDGAR